MTNRTKKSYTSELKEFFIPLNEIKVNVYKVTAKNEVHAIRKVIRNKHKLKKVKIIELIETSPNCAFLNNSTEDYLNKTIDFFELSEQVNESTLLKLIK